MADFNYDMFSLGNTAKEKLREVSQEGAVPAGIGAKPADEQEPMDKGFYENMYEAIMSYFDKAEEADKVLTGTKPSRDAIREMTLSEFDNMTLSSAEEAGVLRQDMGKTEAAVPEERKETRLIDVTDTELGKLDNVGPLEKLAEDIDPGTIDTGELDADGVQPTDGKGLMSPAKEGQKRISDREYTLPEVPDNIDTVFLGQQEGAAKTKAYVPTKDGKALDSSGVTVGTGVDLGSKDKNYFRYLDDTDLVSKLEPYFGKKKDAAVTKLKETPLNLTTEEVKKLDAYVKKMEFRALKNRWNQDSSIKWEDLAPGKATAVASVYYQYGPAMFKHNFWTQTTEGQWQQAYNNLMNYGDKYSSRRKREAAVLKKAL